MCSSPDQKLITLMSSDKKVFEVEEAVAVESETIKNTIEDGCADSAIPLPNVTGTILGRVITYCRKHAAANNITDESWDLDFLRVDMETLFDLILAANYLNIKGLLELTCQTVADMIRGKTPEEIRNLFNIPNDFTPKEEEDLKKEYQWAFE